WPELGISRDRGVAGSVLHQVVRVCADRAATDAVPAGAIAREDAVDHVDRAADTVADPSAGVCICGVVGDGAVYDCGGPAWSVEDSAAVASRTVVAVDGAIDNGKRAGAVVKNTAAPRTDAPGRVAADRASDNCHGGAVDLNAAAFVFLARGVAVLDRQPAECDGVARIDYKDRSRVVPVNDRSVKGVALKRHALADLDVFGIGAGCQLYEVA